MNFRVHIAKHGVKVDNLTRHLNYPEKVITFVCANGTKIFQTQGT